MNTGLTVSHTDAAGKTRHFTGRLVTLVQADPIWEGGRSDTTKHRPIFMAVACSSGASAPFVANLSMGATASWPDPHNPGKDGGRIELLRSAGYRKLSQTTPQGVLTTFYLPDLYERDPVMVDPKWVALAVLPRRSWVEAQTCDAASITDHLARVAALTGKATEFGAEHVGAARLFGEALDRRVRVPLPSDDRFMVQLLDAARRVELLQMKGRGYLSSQWYKEDGAEQLGYSPGFAFRGTQTQVEEFIGAEVRIYFAATR